MTHLVVGHDDEHFADDPGARPRDRVDGVRVARHEVTMTQAEHVLGLAPRRLHVIVRVTRQPLQGEQPPTRTVLDQVHVTETSVARRRHRLTRRKMSI